MARQQDDIGLAHKAHSNVGLHFYNGSPAAASWMISAALRPGGIVLPWVVLP